MYAYLWYRVAVAKQDSNSWFEPVLQQSVPDSIAIATLAEYKSLLIFIAVERAITSRREDGENKWMWREGGKKGIVYWTSAAAAAAATTAVAAAASSVVTYCYK